MRVALLCLIFSSVLFANSRKVIFRDMSTGEFRVLQNGALAGPFTGVADGVNSAGEGPLGIIYYDATKFLEITTTHGTADPKHVTEVAEVAAAIAEYNWPKLNFAAARPWPGGEKGDWAMPTYFDIRTGLILTQAESKTAPSFNGFIFKFLRGKRHGQTAGDVPPPFWVRQVAEATLRRIPPCKFVLSHI